MAGDGLAVDPTGNTIVSPVDGKLALVFDTKHAFAITLDNGAELLVHIGIDTVSLNGEGFEQLIEAGVKVKAGTPIIRIDRDFIVSKGFSLITPVLITNMDIVKDLNVNINEEVVAGQDEVLTFSV